MRAILTFALFLLITPFTIRADEPAAASSVTINHARFTALTPRLIRMEYSDVGAFEDRPSMAFVDRTPTATLTQSKDPAGTHVLKTSELSIRYVDDGQPFNEKNLSISQLFKFKKTPTIWMPGTADTGNLLGTFRTLDGVNGATQLEKGILSRDGWAIVDDSGKPVLDSTSGRPWFAERKDPAALDWYYFGYGHDYKEALGDFTKFAGKIPLPPRYVFGAWWSRYWAYSDAELRELVNEFKENDVPLDVLVIDMDWHLDGWTGYTWNPKYFPDPEGFLKWAHEQGLKVTLNLHPADGVGKHEKAFPEVCKAMGLDPYKTQRVPFDCTDPIFVDAYFKYLHHPLEKMGIDFWWMDWQQGTDTKVKNLDPLMALNHLHWQDMAERAEETGKRPLIFSRWGGLGNHRYQIGFSGDTFCNWPSLAFQPYFTATAGNVGYAYWSHDIGGHQPGPVDPELYVRWIQWGALSPILRTHTTKNPLAERRIWKFPTEYFEAARKAYQFRYELIPYIYTMARKCHDTGIPLCRPLYYEWPEMEEAYTWKNEYMFGDDLLAAPVTEAADPISGCAMVEVWIPPGKWVNWFTGRQYDGPTTAHLVVPLDEIPLFARAGAIIPTQVVREVEGLQERSTILNVFPGGTDEIRVNLGGAHANSEDFRDGPTRRVISKVSDNTITVEIQPTEGLHSQDASEVSKISTVRFIDTPYSEESMTLNGRRVLPELEMELKEDINQGYSAFQGNFIDLPQMKLEQAQVIEFPLSAGLKHMDGIRACLKSCEFVSETASESNVDIGEVRTTDFTHLLGLMSKEQVKQEIADQYLGYFEIVDSSIMSQAQKIQSLVRLFGLYYRLSQEPSKSDPSIFEVELEACNTHPFPPTDELEATLVIEQQPGFELIGRDPQQVGITKHQSKLMCDEPVKLTATLKVDQIPITTLLKARVDFGCRGFGFTVPIERILFPSIGSWQILGPFDVPFAKSFDTKFPPEDKIDLAAEYDGKDGRKIKWQLVERKITPETNLTDEFFIDFDDVFGGRVYECVAYALTYLDAPEDMDAVLAFGTDDGCIVRLNGQEVFRVNVGRPYTSKQNRVPVKLKKGENELLLKINQGGGDWGFCVHLESPDGKPLPQVKTRVTPKAKE